MNCAILNKNLATVPWRWSLDFVGSTNWYYLDLILLPSYTPSSCSNPKYSRHSPRLILSLFERWFEKCSSPRDINWASDNVGHALLENFMTDNYYLTYFDKFLTQKSTFQMQIYYAHLFFYSGFLRQKRW